MDKISKNFKKYLCFLLIQTSTIPRNSTNLTIVNNTFQNLS